MKAQGSATLWQPQACKKGSLYKAFGSKHEMYVRALSHYESIAVDGAVKMLTGTNPPKDRISALLNAPIDAAYNKNDHSGCFLCNAAADYAAFDADTRRLVDRGYGKMLKALKAPVAQLSPALSSKEVNANAALVLSVYAGLRIMARAAIGETF